MSSVASFSLDFRSLAFFLLWLSVVVLLFLPPLMSGRQRVSLILLVYLVVFLAAVANGYVHSFADSRNPLRLLDGKQVVASGVLVSFPRYSSSGISFFLRITEASTEDFRIFHPRGVGTVYVFVRDAQKVPISFLYRVTLSGTISKARASSNRGGFSMRNYLRAFGVDYQMFVPHPSFVYSAEASSFVGSLFYGLKERFVRKAEASFDSPYSDLLLGLTIGDSAIYFPNELKETFRRAGLTHLLVVSGTQVSLFFLIVGLLLLRLESPFSITGIAVRLFRYPLIFLLVLSYSILTGFEPSIQRAFIVSVLILIAHFYLYETDSLHLLGQAGLIITIIKPAEIYSVSFQLTFAATLGLILAVRAIRTYFVSFSFWKQSFLVLLASTSGAQIMVMPILLFYFNQLTPYGLISNLIAIPISFFVIVLALAFYILGFVPILGQLISWAALMSLKFLKFWATLFASFPGSAISFGPISGFWAFIAFVLLLIAFIELGLGTRRSRFILVGASFVLASVVTVCSYVGFTRLLPQLRVFYLSSGSASLYIGKDRAGILFVDFPPSDKKQEQLLTTLSSLLSRAGVKRLSSAIILSDSAPQPRLWARLPTIPDALINAAETRAYFSSSSLEFKPGPLEMFFDEKAQVALFVVHLSESVCAVIASTSLSRDALNLRLPSNISGSLSGSASKLLLLLPRSYISKKASMLGNFIRANSVDTLIIQGSSRGNNFEEKLLPGLKVFTQSEHKEIDILPSGEVLIFNE